MASVETRGYSTVLGAPSAVAHSGQCVVPVLITRELIGVFGDKRGLNCLTKAEGVVVTARGVAWRGGV